MKVPTLRRSQSFKKPKFLKFDFGKLYKHDKDMAVHILDPWLLAIKAAANWSGCKGDKLLPACIFIENQENHITILILTLKPLKFPQHFS